MENLTYKLELFEGPLDLLLSLITKNKISIDDIPISLLCDQYMEYIDSAAKADIELASDFIVVASELMLIKSRMLLPRTDEEEEDPRASLAAALLEYKRAKEAAALMKPRFDRYGLRMAKETDEITIDRTYVADHDFRLLSEAYMRVLSEVRVSDAEAKEKFKPLLEKKTVSVTLIVENLARRLSGGNRLSLCRYFRTAEDRSELVSMFLAMLELLKSGLLLLEEGEFENGDGVIDAESEITIYLDESADISALTNIVRDV